MPITIQERLEIRALRGSFAAAANRRNFDQFAAIFADDGVWHIPDMHAEFRGRAVIRGGIEHMLGLWEVFVRRRTTAWWRAMQYTPPGAPTSVKSVDSVLGGAN